MTNRPASGARLACLFQLLLAGCGLTTGPFDVLESQRELTENMSRWHDHGFASYDYVVSNQCFCIVGGVPVVVSVPDNAIVGVVDAGSGQPLSGERAAYYRDVPGQFQLIRAAIDAKAASIRAVYDPATGYPADVFIDYDRNAVDEERGFKVLSFTPVQR